ncbi:MAG: glycosyltransferase family 4 protein [Betaproteobacteria bacterium]|nr:glycosyltransferase family 4 protein [Betaproteobacteria bacterium]
MKLALIRAKYNPFGGAERFLNDAVAALSGGDVQCTLFTRAWHSEPSSVLAHRIVNPSYLTSAGRDRGFAAAVKRAMATEIFDLVQSYERLDGVDIYHAVDGVHAEWLRRRQAIQSRWQRAGVAMNPHHRFVLQIERAMYTSPQLKAVICISEMVRQDVLRHFPVDPAKLHVIYSGVDSARFSPVSDPTEKAATRASLGIPREAPMALFVGSGFERKGLAAFLAALAACPGVTGVVVGKDKHSARYQAQATRLGLQGRVMFTGGVTDTRPYYRAADVFVLPTIYEPFGLVCLEAMACGLPVVTSTAAGAAEVITPGVNGFVTEATDVAAISHAINTVLQAPAMRDAARAAALAFTHEAMAARYVALYRQLLPTQ